MRDSANLLIGLGIGAGLMYLLDPDRGHRRRCLLRDRMVHSGHQLVAGLDRSARDLQNRTVGTLASLQSAFDDNQPDDEVLVERVRAHLGRVSSHPGAIDVAANDGVISLSGPILAREVQKVMACAESVRGVKGVRNRMQVHQTAANVPGLQGQAVRRAGEQPAFLQSNWPPATRALGCAVGALALMYGMARRGLLGAACATSGSVLLLRAATNLEMRRLTGIGGRRRAIDVQKTIHIHAPIEKVFAAWANFENFPSFMEHVRQVRRVDDGRQGEYWRWTVDGPAGVDVQFDVAVVCMEPNQLIRWRTSDGSLVQHSGQVRFFRNGDSTRADIKMTYNPVAGALGHAVARLFNADPKHRMDQDLVRLKTFIETGKIPHDAALRRGNGQEGLGQGAASSEAAQPAL